MPTKARNKPAAVPNGNEARYIPMQRYTRVEYVESDGPEDAPPFWAKIRANLTFSEVEVLVWDKETPIREVWDAVAPHVVEWNAATLNDAGEVVDLESSAVADSSSTSPTSCSGSSWSTSRQERRVPSKKILDAARIYGRAKERQQQYQRRQRTTNVKVPEMPDELGQALMFDLSPLRPNAWLVTEAARWNQAVALRNAYANGVEDARAELSKPSNTKR